MASEENDGGRGCRRMPPQEINAKPIHRPSLIGVLPLSFYDILPVIVLLISLAVLSPPTTVNANQPVEQRAWNGSYLLCSVRTLRLTAGENGPYVTLADVRARSTSRDVHPTAIKPPVTKQYPLVLRDVPIAARTYTSRTITYLAQHEIRFGDGKKPTIALTFDCETGPSSTRRILQVLREKDTRATFFVLGRYGYMFPDIIREIAADGHELGNHSFFHPLFQQITPITATMEITFTEAVVDWAVGRHVPMRYFRFPYGGRNDSLRHLVSELGYQSTFWDIDPRGWDPNTTPNDIVHYIRGTAHCGGIIIMHCGSWDDANALGDIIDTLREKGLAPGTLSDVVTLEDHNIPDYTLPGASTSP